MTCKKFHKEVMEEGLKWRQAEQESRRWYAGGLQSFRLRGESHLDVCRVFSLFFLFFSYLTLSTRD